MPQHIMNDTDFYNLRVCWNDFFLGISSISIDHINSDENKTEWTKLRSSFHYVKGRRYTQQEIVTESMANLLHKYMAVTCTSYLVREIEQSCPGWPWLLMEMDAQVAKQVGRHTDAEMRSTDMSMLLQQLNPLHV